LKRGISEAKEGEREEKKKKEIGERL